MGARMHNRVAIVTGGGGEIGGAIARRFAAEGAAVLVADISLDKAKAVVDAIVADGGKAAPCALDVARADQCEAATQAAVDHFGKLTTLVNAAVAVTPDGNVEALALEDWEAALRA